MKSRFPASLLLIVAFLLSVVVLSAVYATPTFLTREKVIEETLSQEGLGSTETVAGDTGGKSVARAVQTKPGLVCAAGRNGGSTDTGVTGTGIKLGATVVRSGIGSAFLGGAPTAMQALVDKVNREGGVCGRLLDLKMIDDGWSANAGAVAIRSLIDQGVFALAVSPSSEGVHVIVEAGDLKKKGVPLVGADGLVKAEYQDPWVWPVAASTVSTMHIIAQEAFNRLGAGGRGARTFGIVYEKDYKFGVEGAYAFSQAVNRLTGSDIPGFNPNLSTCRETFCGILSGQPSYSSEVQEFNSACNRPNPKSGYNPGDNPAAGSLPSCDFVALLLEPKTALTWLTKNGGAAPKSRTMGPQPLFSANFARQCDAICNEIEVWTSYNPPLAPYANQAPLVEYGQTVRTLDPSIDVANSFTEGAYLGMLVLVEALKRVGPNLTRANLKAVLDSGTYDFGLSPTLSWRPGNHLGAGQMQSYLLQYQGNSFIAFSPKTPFVKDSMLGEDL